MKASKTRSAARSNASTKSKSKSKAPRRKARALGDKQAGKKAGKPARSRSKPASGRLPVVGLGSVRTRPHASRAEQAGQVLEGAGGRANREAAQAQSLRDRQSEAEKATRIRETTQV